jgi:hypothetical protein
MTVPNEIVLSLGAFALIGGRICGGIGWHHLQRMRREREARRNDATEAGA